ncbi:hypothetical protein [Roseiterribacter gracilis]|uniref:Uncharacterized protein n=1 Tax=Roseiterribacter gracilis TaxID=2812848 RepID=A0A8S8XE72_9PROT|nr:hypothetical protein TMPK1_24890 [Rhodospirillales bacterium TMPK1]
MIKRALVVAALLAMPSLARAEVDKPVVVPMMTPPNLVICIEEKDLREALRLARMNQLGRATMPKQCGWVEAGLRAIELGGDEVVRKLRIWKEGSNSVVVWGSIIPKGQ